MTYTYTLTLIASISLVTILGIRQLWKNLLAHSWATETICNEVKDIDKHPNQKYDETAIVIGAGIGGCLTAAMLSRHFKKVQIIDPLDIDLDPRSYIAQIDQAHNIGTITLQCCESLWPNDIFMKKLHEFGGRVVHNHQHPYEFATKSGYLKWSSKPIGFDEKGFLIISATRRQVHHILRYLLHKQTPNVEFMLGKVDKVHFKKDNEKLIDSIDIVQDGKQINKSCSLFVDCSGPASVYRHLLSKSSRYNTTKVEEYCQHVQYSTGVIELHPDLQARWPKISTIQQPKDENYNTSGVIAMLVPTLSNDANFWLMNRCENSKISLANMSYESKPLNEMPNTLDQYQNGWNASHFALFGENKAAWFEEVMDLLRENEELTGEKFKCVRARDYRSYCLDSTHNRLPSNMILLGDSFCKLNPAFGQGCQKASSEVVLLHSLLLNNHANQDLQSNLDKALPQYYERQSILAKRLFDLNRALDMSQPEVIKANPQLNPKIGADVRFLSKGMWNWMGKKGDTRMGDLFMRINLDGTAAPALLLHPTNLFRILYGALFL
jgi:2-polyprenyl-6-methoxyphenol hydroxylase-like FAD-dependent oxidoreductase